jgi:site-specific recombinase XerD
MFESLFHYPRVLARHREGPFARERDRYLCFCGSGGAAQATLLRIARELLVIASRIDLSGDRLISSGEIDIAADRWVRHQRRGHRIRTSEFSRRLFVQTANAWFRFLGRLECPGKIRPPYAAFVDEFADYMHKERGLSPKTIFGRRWYAHDFLHWLDEQGECLDELRLEQVDTFLSLKGQHGCCRVSLASNVNALRAFFRYSAEHGRCSMQLANGIEGPRLFRQEGLPVGPSWLDVQRLIAAVDTDRPQDIRDRAILLLLAVYGLRAGEVVGLNLLDVEWEQSILHVARSKQRCKQDYPLVAEVGNAIVRYLQEVRPRCLSRSLFVTIRAPFHSLSIHRLYGLVRSQMDTLSIACLRHGPHALRHAVAAHLVAEGVTLSQIGDHLGHRSTYATRNYARVDLVRLREVANVNLGDLL